MRIAIGGILHESNTFIKLPTTRQRFEEGSLTFGDAILPVWSEAHHEMGGFISASSAFGYELLPTVMALATPAGPVTDAALDEFVDRIISDCGKHPIDGLLLALHGAMVTPSHFSGDTEILRRIRKVLGPELPIAVTLDFHGNCTPEMGEYANIIVGYQTYPHIDQRIRGILAAELLVHTINREINPVTVVVKSPLLINLLGQATDREPMRSLMTRARQLEHQEGMLSVSLMAGFAYSDVPDAGASVISVADGDHGLARAIADTLIDRLWSVREELNAPCLTPREAVHFSLATDRTPVVLVDLGDNIGGGSAGDGTILLAELLKQRASGAVVVLYAPEAVRAATSLGLGNFFNGIVGGSVDSLHGSSMRIQGVVTTLHDGKWEEPEARHGGRRHNDQGMTAVLTIEGPNTLVLNSRRTPPFSLGQLTSLGIDVRQARIIVVKAAVAYKAAYAPIAGRIIEVDTPGATAINPVHFEYKNIRRPIYPLDPS
jgi:microcystin degradation protein MlrC